MENTITIYLVCLGVLLLGSILDTVSSLGFSELGMREMNPLWRDKDGNVAEKRGFIFLGGLCALQAVIHFAAGGQTGLFFNMLCGGIGFARAVISVSNFKGRAEAIRKIKEQKEREARAEAEAKAAVIQAASNQ